MQIQDLRAARILIVDDETSNISSLETILRADGYTQIAATDDPRRALTLVRETQPDLVILDLNMPLMDGFDVMHQVRALHEKYAFLPVMVVSGDYAEEVKRKALAAGAQDFLTRPFDAIEIQLRVQNLLEARFLHVQLRDQNENLEQRVHERTLELESAQLELKEAQIEIIVRLAMAAEFRDKGTGDHTRRVGLIASLIAQSLELSAHDVELIRRAAPLHDVGKIGVADPILLKAGKLDAAEFETVKTHCRIGAQVLAGGQAELVQMAERIALYHHEHWDGTGYPTGISGEAIPIEARILAVADVFDALTHQRPYKQAWPLEQALEEIEYQSGRQFDPTVVNAFLSLPHDELI